MPKIMEIIEKETFKFLPYVALSLQSAASDCFCVTAAFDENCVCGILWR